MIVELFGPPAVGKTRFAHALEGLARSRGIPLALAASERPAERATGARLPAVLSRLATARAALLSHAAPGAPGPHEALLRAFPPRSRLWALRLRHYLQRLDATMRRGASEDGVLVIDQGFVQALGSLLVLARYPARAAAREAALETALETTPRADLLVRLHAPPAVLRLRLRQRFARMSLAERLLELGLEDNLAFLAHLDHIQSLLEAGGTRVIAVDTSSPDTMLPGTLHVLEAILATHHQAASAAPQRAPSQAVAA